MDRLGRNAVELDQLIKGFTSKGIKVQFIKEGYLFTGDDSPMNKLLICMMVAWAEFERNTIR
ncbi:MAG: recombinase family protein [Simkaniaceae bacterium]|nr:recombinase family protein [Simkaniaceae bacterium]